MLHAILSVPTISQPWIEAHKPHVISLVIGIALIAFSVVAIWNFVSSKRFGIFSKMILTFSMLLPLAAGVIVIQTYVTDKNDYVTYENMKTERSSWKFKEEQYGVISEIFMKKYGAVASEAAKFCIESNFKEVCENRAEVMVTLKDGSDIAVTVAVNRGARGEYRIKDLIAYSNHKELPRIDSKM